MYLLAVQSISDFGDAGKFEVLVNFASFWSLSKRNGKECRRITPKNLLFPAVRQKKYTDDVWLENRCTYFVNLQEVNNSYR
jgi:hypothetical protein